MKVTEKERSAANPPSHGDSPQKDSAEHESYAGVRNPVWEKSGATIPPDKPNQANRIAENNITNANEPKERLLERILDRGNMNAAYKRVKSNKGAGGVDKMQVADLLPYLAEHGETIKQAIMEGKYKPNPVRRVEIPKDDGKKRPLGIPTVVDRVIQQSIAQILSPIFEKQFSDDSFGFRPNRSAHGAIKRSQENIEDGYKYVVDMDLEKFFDTVNQSKLVEVLGHAIKDGRVINIAHTQISERGCCSKA
jgi:retron-type reverse transcriptase